MRIRVFLLPSSMPLTVHLCLLVTSALLLFLCSARSCLGTKYQDCLYSTSTRCGGGEFSYPSVKNDSRCGEPDFQFQCDDHQDVPVLHIRQYKYRLWPPDSVGKDGSHTLTIVYDPFEYNTLCTTAHINQSLWQGSKFLHIADEYTNVKFWKNCTFPNKILHGFKMLNSSECDYDWYYSVDSGLDSQGAGYCETYFQLPIQKHSPLPNNIEELLPKGFNITWNYDPSNGGSKKAIIIGCSIGGSALIAIVIAALFLRFYAKRRKTLSRGLASEDMEAAMLPRREIGNLPIFSYEELQQATNCFHEENELGDGGFGSVYLGKLRDGRTVAVKRLYQDNSRRLEQFINEVKVFSTLNHPHVVRLYGCTSADSPELLLVYEFVPNGTLDDHLHGDRKNPKGLPWNTRLNIAVQTAQALAFLHGLDPPIFHRDVKSSNILLDENLDIKLADFGLCRLLPVDASHVTTIPQGTPGYVDPEYYQCYQLTEKSDVYSFGVVLVEIISAKIAMDINRNRREINLANLAVTKIQEGALDELVDPQLEIEVNHEVKMTVSAVAELAFRCLASERDDRPQMEEIVAQLEEIRDSCETSTGPAEQRLGTFFNIKQSNTVAFSPISVQDKWPSLSSTPEYPPHKCINISV